ncbi:hypothetical protein J2S43_003984 [Catenuloplanes nepalensis]|uniref:Uncharacterized protein n=1 Tax=Catenuloplanes nepalensis TaxID=587533 RepID=A0ABT9MVJ5_9ACTN|nr:hypothetical protein [Catenuloplanes nepalensis]MDP9795472.1 hypothetical protein [Catenuloplanes nepalensis]
MAARKGRNPRITPVRNSVAAAAWSRARLDSPAATPAGQPGHDPQ